jgi:regulator of sirC expression with transglutaminase-like and TPR domain
VIIDEKEIQAMVRLLDDTDSEVVRMIEERLLLLGEDVLPYLEGHWESEYSLAHQERLEHIIHKIHLASVGDALRGWLKAGYQDLFEGICILAKYRYPSLDVQHLSNSIEEIRLSAWLEMHYDLTPLEKIRILNHIFYNVYRFEGAAADYYSPDNSYINKVLERRKGNPVSLAVIYIIVAQRLGIPVFGVNFPRQFILAYVWDEKIRSTGLEERNRLLSAGEIKKVVFYIHPFHKGLVFTRQNIDEFVRQLHLQPEDHFYTPCNNVEILKRMLRNLINSYAKDSDAEKVHDLEELLGILERNAGIADA